jgi:BlaI family penicillinase repressor
LNEEKRAVQYTSTLKLMQIMVEKTLLTRDESQMKHIYIPAAEEQVTKGFLLERFVDTLIQRLSQQLADAIAGQQKNFEERTGSDQGAG